MPDIHALQLAVHNHYHKKASYYLVQNMTLTIYASSWYNKLVVSASLVLRADVG
jgi:hypothetical protein